MNIQDSAFDRAVTLRQAYRIMDRFLSAYHARGESSTVELLMDVGLAPNGQTGDPAALYDFLDAVAEVENA
jgi:hypothetical protein